MMMYPRASPAHSFLKMVSKLNNNVSKRSASP